MQKKNCSWVQEQQRWLNFATYDNCFTLTIFNTYELWTRGNSPNVTIAFSVTKTIKAFKKQRVNLS